jgi:hypothetical protein
MFTQSIIRRLVREELTSITGTNYSSPDHDRFKVGDLVKDINPNCPHHGAEGVVTKVTKDSVMFVVNNTGRGAGKEAAVYQPGDELEKTKDQMRKLTQEGFSDGSKRFEKERLDNAEVLGYKLVGVTDGGEAAVTEAKQLYIVKGMEDFTGKEQEISTKLEKAKANALIKIIKKQQKQSGMDIYTNMRLVPVEEATNSLSFPGKIGEHAEFLKVNEVAPKGWEGTVKAMKDEKGIDNPWALAWWMKKKGYKSHKEVREGAIFAVKGKSGPGGHKKANKPPFKFNPKLKKEWNMAKINLKTLVEKFERKIINEGVASTVWSGYTWDPDERMISSDISGYNVVADKLSVARALMKVFAKKDWDIQLGKVDQRSKESISHDKLGDVKLPEGIYDPYHFPEEPKKWDGSSKTSKKDFKLVKVIKN